MSMKFDMDQITPAEKIVSGNAHYHRSADIRANSRLTQDQRTQEAALAAAYETRIQNLLATADLMTDEDLRAKYFHQALRMMDAEESDFEVDETARAKLEELRAKGRQAAEAESEALSRRIEQLEQTDSEQT